MALRPLRLEICGDRHHRDVVAVHGLHQPRLVADLADRDPLRLRHRRGWISAGKHSRHSGVVQEGQPAQNVGAAAVVELCWQHDRAADHGAADPLAGLASCLQHHRHRWCIVRGDLFRLRSASRAYRRGACDGEAPGADARAHEESAAVAADGGVVRPELRQQGPGFLDAALSAPATRARPQDRRRGGADPVRDGDIRNRHRRLGS